MATLLIADDNAAIREFCRCELAEEGYFVLEARDGAEAVAQARQFRPDVIVLDICMPNVNGLEALTRIRRVQPDAAVILFTAYDDACLHDKRSLVATACVAKSHDLTELKQVVSGVLKSRRDKTNYRVGLPPLSMAAG